MQWFFHLYLQLNESLSTFFRRYVRYDSTGFRGVYLADAPDVMLHNCTFSGMNADSVGLLSGKDNQLHK